MKLTILGTGCAWTRRECASYCINDNIMVDPAYSSIKQLLKTNSKLLHHEKIEKLDLVLITHYHSDHYFDMPYILQKEATGKFPDRKLTIVGPPGLVQNLKDLCRLAISQKSNSKIDIEKWCNCIEADHMKTIKFQDYEITCVLLDHGDTVNYGYMIKLPNGKTLSFTGDSKMCPNEEYMLDHSDIMVMNMASTVRSSSHYNIVEGIELMKKYQNKCVIIPAHLTSQAYDYAKGKINLPYDLMILDLEQDKPYDFRLKFTKDVKEDVAFDNKYSEVYSKKVALLLEKLEAADEKHVSVCNYNIIDKQTGNHIGTLKLGLGYDKFVQHMGNISWAFDNETSFDNKAEACKLAIDIAKNLGFKKATISSSTTDMEERKICESVGASIKELKYFSRKDNLMYGVDDAERCIWEIKLKD